MFELALDSPRPQVPIQDPPYHTWVLRNGDPWIDFYRTADRYLLRFPGLADFELSLDGQAIACFPAPKVSELAPNLIQHIYMNQVLPLALSRKGELVFHASAVEIENVAVAFVAESQRGKSTLAASFATNGFRFITDDGLVVKPSANGYVVQPNQPFIRLWRDSESALLPHGVRKMPLPNQSSKARYFAGDNLAFCEVLRPLDRMYFLGTGCVDQVTITRLTAAEVLIELVGHSFLLDFQESQGLAHHFDQLGKLANQAFHYRLDYPRRFDELTSVREAVIAHTASELS